MSVTGSFIIAAPQAVAAKLGCIFEKAQLVPAGVYESGAEAIAAAQQAEDGVLLVTTWKLDDMTGVELAQQLGEESDVLMIVPQDYEGDDELVMNVMPLHNPISPEALAQSVRVLTHCRVQMGALRKRARKLERMLEDRKLIDRAKGRLMDTQHMTEAEAHHYIQKKSMDSGCRLADIAREILEAPVGEE